MKRKIVYYAGTVVHPFYAEQFSNPPQQFQTYSLSPLGQCQTIRKDYTFLHRFRRPLEKVNRLIRAFVPILNWHNLKHKCDNCLVHSGQRLLRDISSYVVDVEQIGAFGFHDGRILSNRAFKDSLAKALTSKRLYCILPWTNMSLKSIEAYFSDHQYQQQIIEKCHVILPAIRPATKSYKKLDLPYRLLFVGGAFLYKGGLETILSFQDLSKKYSQIELHIVSFAPEEYLKEFSHLANVKIYTAISEEKLRYLFCTCHILVMPQHTDTLGWVLFEGFSYGMPVVVTDNFSTSELVSTGKTGIVLKNPVSFWDENGLQRYSWWEDVDFAKELLSLCRSRSYINSICDAVELILQDYKTYSNNCLDVVSTGKLSFEKRNMDLSTVYNNFFAV